MVFFLLSENLTLGFFLIRDEVDVFWLCMYFRVNLGKVYSAEAAFLVAFGMIPLFFTDL